MLQYHIKSIYIVYVGWSQMFSVYIIYLVVKRLSKCPPKGKLIVGLYKSFFIFSLYTVYVSNFSTINIYHVCIQKIKTNTCVCCFFIGLIIRQDRDNFFQKAFPEFLRLVYKHLLHSLSPPNTPLSRVAVIIWEKIEIQRGKPHLPPTLVGCERLEGELTNSRRGIWEA